MKKQLLLLCVALMGIALSCKKDKTQDPKPDEKEGTITKYIEATTELEELMRTSGPWELGVQISSSTKGKVTKLGCKMPQIGKYIVTVWDADTKEKLRQTEINQTADGSLVLQDITPLAVNAGKKYVVSVNSKDLISSAHKSYYYAANTSRTSWMPVTAKTVTLHSAQYSFSGSPVFPEDAINVYDELYGFPEFTFVPD